MNIGGEKELCFQITYYGNLYYLNKTENVIVCLDCFYNLIMKSSSENFKKVQITKNFLFTDILIN
jgi:hypothetical protein